MGCQTYRMVHTVKPFPREMESDIHSGEGYCTRARENKEGDTGFLRARVPRMCSTLVLECIHRKAKLCAGQNEHDAEKYSAGKDCALD